MYSHVLHKLLDVCYKGMCATIQSNTIFLFTGTFYFDLVSNYDKYEFCEKRQSLLKAFLAKK